MVPSAEDRQSTARSLRRAILPVLAGIGLIAVVALSPGFARFRPAAPSTPAIDRGDDAAWQVEDPSVHEAAAYEETAPPASIADDVVDASGDAPLDCLIEPSRSIDLGSEIVGLIESIKVERSEFVEQGQVLVQLESSVKRASLEIARARAEMDAAILARVEAQKLGREKRLRAKRLYDEKTMSLEVRREIETEARIAELHLQEALDAKHLAKLEFERADRDLARRTIVSPVSGVVVERLMNEGEVVDDDKVILRIAKIDPLRVEAILPAASFGTIEIGQKAMVTPEVPGDTLHVASVSLVERVIDPASGTFGVSLDLPNPNNEIPSGLNCEVRFVDP